MADIFCLKFIINVILLNLVLAFILLVLNLVLGHFIYNYSDLFDLSYGVFDFSKKDVGFSGNFWLVVINPTVFIVLVICLMEKSITVELCWSFLLTILFYWLIRILIVLLNKRIHLLGFKSQFVCFALSCLVYVICCKFVMIPLVSNGVSIMVSAEELREAVWVGIFFYIARTIWKIFKRYTSKEFVYPTDKVKKYIKDSCKKYKNKYGVIIDNSIEECSFSSSESKQLFECLVYSIMIFEDYNRSEIYRRAEKLLIKTKIRKSATLGIMQVKTDKYISNEESIKIGVNKLFYNYSKNENIDEAIRDYNTGEEYLEQVKYIFNTICSES